MVPHIVFHVPAPDYSPGTGAVGLCRLRAGAPGVRRAGSPSRRCSPPPSACCTRRRRIGRSWRRSSRRSSAGTRGFTASADRRGSHRDRPPVGGSRQLAALRPRAGAARGGRRASTSAHGPTARRSTRRSGRPTRDYVRYLYLVRRCERRSYRPTLDDCAVRLRRSHLQLDPRRSRGRPGLALGRARRRRSRASAAATRVRDALADRWDDERAVYVEDDGDRRRRTRRSMRCSRSTPACRTGSRRAACSTRRSGRRRASAPRPTHRGR